MSQDFFHQPVMTKEVTDFLGLKKDGIYVDATLGAGGHTEALLRELQVTNYKLQIIAIDQDEEAINFAKKRLKKYGKNIIFIHDNFRNLNHIVTSHEHLHISSVGADVGKIDGVLLDLGVSSYQFDEPSRGFSFRPLSQIPDQVRNDVSLDMRMDQRQSLSAYEVINNYSEADLVKIFFEFGEERFSRQIAREIVKRRQEKKIKTASDLVAIIKSATPPGYRFSQRHHFATKIFQALRIEVNQELEALKEFLPQAVECLKPGGRLVIISFHSLEDRIVKHFFREQKNQGTLNILTKKPLTPSSKEIQANPRSKSAKLRVVEKI